MTGKQMEMAVQVLLDFIVNEAGNDEYLKTHLNVAIDEMVYDWKDGGRMDVKKMETYRELMNMID